jgi:hypothetical protein
LPFSPGWDGWVFLKGGIAALYSIKGAL